MLFLNSSVSDPLSPVITVFKTAQPQQRAPLQLGYLLQMIAVDIMGPFPQNKNGNCYILVAEDYFTKWSWAIPNQEAKHKSCWICLFVFLCLRESIQIGANNQFESRELCNLLQIEKTHTTLYHPQRDGLVERANRTILNMLAMVVDNYQD